MCTERLRLSLAPRVNQTLEMLENDTRNQHFVTQGEQRLNALNPHADLRNQRIFSFEVVDRESYTLKLENPIGRPIGKSLERSGTVFRGDDDGGETGAST